MWQEAENSLPSALHTLTAENSPPLPLHTHASQQMCSLPFLTMFVHVGLSPTRTLAHVWLLNTLTWPCFPEDQLPLSLTLASPFLACED